MRKLIVCFALILPVARADDMQTGYRAAGLRYTGPGEWKIAAEPIWVFDYHQLRMRYRASGLGADDTPVLTLRPGAVGPVTPGAANLENPFAIGMPVTVVRARDLAADGAPHALEIDLKNAIKTAQMDQLIFSLPAGARLEVEDLEFRSDAGALSCDGGAAPLPPDVERLVARGPIECAGAAATSLRGRESIRIEGAGKRGGTLYFSALAHFAGVPAFAPGRPTEAARPRESSEPAFVSARITYASGPGEEQFPLLVSDRRRAMLNRKAALYALELDPRRPLAAVELLDRSPHAQIVLFDAGVSQAATPGEKARPLPPVLKSRGPRSGVPALTGSRWFRLVAGNPDALKPELRNAGGPAGRTLSLTVTNTSDRPQEFTLAFPSLEIRPAEDAADVYYLVPRQGAVISSADASIDVPFSGALPLQFVDVFAPRANRGAAVIVRDPEGAFKTFRLRKSGAQVSVEVEYPIRLAPGGRYRLPDVALALHNGDWREGFRAYRDWLAAWYKPRGPRPAWLGKAFWARRDYPVGGSGKLFDVRANRYTYDELMRDGKLFGGIDFIDISGWALSETVGRVGDYPIELGGPADLRKNVTLGWKSGVPTGLYFEGFLVDRNSAAGKRGLEAWQIVDERGRGAWWPGGSPEFFACPYVTSWQEHLAGRVAAVAKETGAQAVYLDEYGVSRRRCYATTHGHAPGAGTVPGEIAMTRAVRRALDAAGLRSTAIYLEENAPDAAAPWFDATFSYGIAHANLQQSPLKLNLWRFAFPDILVWEMLSAGVHPRVLPAEDFRLAVWHGNGFWLKGHAETWYGDELLAFIRKARGWMHQHAAAFRGAADPLVDSPHPSVYVNRFRGGGQTVYTLFNAGYRTARFRFHGVERAIPPREVEVIQGR